MALVPVAYRREWLVVPLLAVVAGLMEGGAAGAVYLLVRVLQDPQTVFYTGAIRPIQGLFTGATDSGIVLRFAGLLGLYHIAKNLMLVSSQYLQYRVQAHTKAELSKELLRGYLLLPYPFHFRRHSSELIRNITGSVGMVTVVLSSTDGLLREVLVGVGILVVLFISAPGVTLISGLALSVLIWGLLRVTRKLAARHGQERHELARSLYETVQSALGGIKEIKALGREEYFLNAFGDVQRRMLSLGYLGATLSLIPQVVVETAFVLAALSVVALLAFEPSAWGEVLPLVGLFAYAGFRMVPMANRIVLRLNELRAGAPAVDDLYDDFVMIRREVDGDWEDAGETVAFRSELRVEDVSYTYPDRSLPAVEDLTLTLRHGESLGIVGPTGAGKSTLVDLVVGLLSPTEGRILADGVELKGRPRRWRQRIGYVPQSIFLLDDTLRRNVALGVPEEAIDDEAVARAVRMAQLHDLVASWPEGVETFLGERGVRLSGGERQRVGIARALYHDPDLLVFDEATSALDNVTEAEVNRAIESLRGQKSMMVIAHRLNTVRRCDRLLYLDEGRIVAEGSYDELIASNSRFRRMAEASSQGS